MTNLLESDALPLFSTLHEHVSTVCSHVSETPQSLSDLLEKIPEYLRDIVKYILYVKEQYTVNLDQNTISLCVEKINTIEKLDIYLAENDPRKGTARFISSRSLPQNPLKLTRNTSENRIIQKSPQTNERIPMESKTYLLRCANKMLADETITDMNSWKVQPYKGIVKISGKRDEAYFYSIFALGEITKLSAYSIRFLRESVKMAMPNVESSSSKKHTNEFESSLINEKSIYDQVQREIVRRLNVKPSTEKQKFFLNMWGGNRTELSLVMS